ncbi:MAG: potassium channel protein [Methanobacterium paludis]|nr:potassium channel protein [Methanobacterium paludis]
MYKYRMLPNATIRNAIILYVLTILAGIAGFMLIEHYDFIDAFFMTIITISTVGFNEVHPLTNDGKIFTAILIIFSLGTLAYVGSKLVSFVFDGEFVAHLKIIRVIRKVEKLRNHVIVCGFGRNGEQVCLELAAHKKPFVIIEKRDNVIERIREHPEFLYVKGDAIHEEMLELAGVRQASALVATTPSDADNVFVVLTARSLNPRIRIISRASEPNSDIKLKRAGATNVIMPERIGGSRMAKLVLQPDVVDFVEHLIIKNDHDEGLEEISCRFLAERRKGQMLKDLLADNNSGTTVVGIRDADGEYVVNPSEEYILTSNLYLFVLGTKEQIAHFQKILHN